MTATGLDAENVADARKRVILLHCLGVEGQHMCASLTDTDTFADAITALTNHLGPATNAMMERYRFRQRSQRHCESVIQYSASLKELASTCNFGELNDEIIRDQIIEKTSIPRIQARLLMEPDTLTLERTIIIATQIEIAIKEAKNFQ